MDELDKVAEAYSQKDLQTLEDSLGVNFCKKHLLITSLSHRSPRGDQLFSKKENKKLGLIGDSLIDLLLFEHNYKKKISLGEMDDERQEVAINLHLDKVAKDLGITNYLFLDGGANEKTVQESHKLGSDSLEALVGALYIEKGFVAAKSFVEKHILTMVTNLSKIKL